MHPLHTGIVHRLVVCIVYLVERRIVGIHCGNHLTQCQEDGDAGGGLEVNQIGRQR